MLLRHRAHLTVLVDDQTEAVVRRPRPARQPAPGDRQDRDQSVARPHEHRVRETELRNAFGDLIARTMIPQLAARQDAHFAQTAIHQFRGGRAMTLQLAYDELLTELPIQLVAPA